MWNDTDEPLAYFITFRTYGTWLHGDERGSVNRHRNVYGSRRIGPEPKWRAKKQARLAAEPVLLNARQRYWVRKSIQHTCEIREWSLFAVNVRTNHAIRKPPGAVLNALKANSTRTLRENGCWQSDRSPWSDKGSTRYLWNYKGLAAACNYVDFGQGDELLELE